MSATTLENVIYRLCKSTLWVDFAPSGHDGSLTWQVQVATRSRASGKATVPLLETTALRPLATVWIGGQSYPLTIGYHREKRGGVLIFGGERKTGTGGGKVAWEMTCKPVPGQPGCYEVEMRATATPVAPGAIQIHLHTPLYRPELWHLPAARQRGHCAVTAYSAYSGQSVGFLMLGGAREACADWDEERGGFSARFEALPMDGSVVARFFVNHAPAKRCIDARTALVNAYAAVADELLYPLATLPQLDPSAVWARLRAPQSYVVKGTERLYLKAPGGGMMYPGRAEEVYAGAPYFPLDALLGLANWERFHPDPNVACLVRYGANGVAADFQVMATEGEAEPNKGAFWDKKVGERGTDLTGGATHGVLSNARIARALFQLHARTGEPLFRQAALNVCQWLILKQNENGYYDGERVNATRGLPDDGKFLPQPCSLDGVEAILPLVMAFRATRNEVFIAAALKIANYIMTSWMPEHESRSAVEAARVVTALLALDAEASKPKLRAAISDWSVRMRIAVLEGASDIFDDDGFSGGLYECAEAGFLLHGHTGDKAALRFAFHALSRISPAAAEYSWRSLALAPMVFLSLARLLTDAVPNYQTLSVNLGPWIFSPDPATDEYLRVTAPGGGSVAFLPLVCRANDSLLMIVLAPPSVESVTIWKNGKQPVVRDLVTGELDDSAALHPLAGQEWARVGFFRVDP